MSIGSIVGLVAGKIGEILVQEATLLYGVEDQVRSLQEELMMMNGFVNNMEAMVQDGADELKCITINQIRRIAYDAEDVIESYILEPNPSTNNKAEDFLKRYACFCISLGHTHQVGSEIEAIKVRITRTMKLLKKYRGENRVSREDAGAGVNRARRRRQIAYPHTDEEHVVGLEEDITKLVGVLTTDGSNIQVLSIVGMGGSGKTTLARKLFNHESVKIHFDCTAWVSISEEWVAPQILLELLRKASGLESTGKDDAWSLQVLVEKLHRYLEGKTYLIVLDDVWTKQALEEIFPALPNDGRRIIVTTRKREVIGFPGLKPYIHEPRLLTDTESWELFRKIAFIQKDQSNSSMDINDFERLGKMMLKKCEGLPLAVIALAGILGEKESIEEWGKVNKAVSSRIVEEGRGTLPYGPVKAMLGLSYDDLPRELKTCFLYLAMFPEDSEIRTGQLIRMWIAEGLITSDMLQEGETLEDVARDYLEKFIRRCVVQSARKNHEGKVRFIRLHDLVRDLCIKKAKEQDFLEICTPQSSNSNARGAELRRTAIYSFDKMYLPLPTQSPRLRSLIYQAKNLSEGDQTLRVQNICQNFKLLRVLILENIRISDGSLPTGIGSLIHLRYLGLRETNINNLPSSIRNLRNLLTLDCMRWLSGKGEDVFKIPDGLWEIEGLRHLQLPGNNSNEGRVKLHAMKHLQTLRGVTGGSWMLEELPRLSPTVQKLSIPSGISSKEQLEAVFRCPSIMEDSLHSLQLAWFIIEGEVMTLEILQPVIRSQHLRKLHLLGRIEDRLSSCNQFPTSITKLQLQFTEFEEEASLAALGKLPNLMLLELYSGSYRGTKWNWIAGQFSKLKELQLQYLSNWEEWSIEIGAMPQLTKLRIYDCEKLRRLPDGLKFITTLQELFIFEKEGGELEKRIKGGGEDGEGVEDAHIVQHVPRVHIYQPRPRLISEDVPSLTNSEPPPSNSCLPT